jgi:thymidylate kinase
MLLRIDEIENVITKYCCNDLVSDKFNDDLSKISASMLVDTNKLKESIDLLATKTKVVPGKISPKLAEKIEQAPEVTMEELEKKESNMKYDLNPGSKEVDAAYDELQKRKNSVMEGIKARHENMCKEIDESLAHINESEEHVEQNKSRINSMLNELKNL